jgi:hypothetical protein
MQDLGICGGEGDPCEGFSMADIDLSFDNYEDIFSSTQGLSSWSSNDIEAAAGCTPVGQDTIGENQCEHMQSIPELQLLEVNNVRFSCLTIESICLCCISVSFFRLMCSTKRDIELNAFTDISGYQFWRYVFWVLAGCHEWCQWLPSNSGIQRGVSWTGAWSTSISRDE